MPNLTETLSETVKNLDEAIKQVCAQIRGLPGNPRIRRVGANSFTMSSGDLGSNWTPFFHDWDQQYEFVCELLEGRCIGRLSEMLEGKTYANRRLAPEVIENVKRLTGDLNLSDPAFKVFQALHRQ